MITRRRNGSTRAYRKARAQVLAYATSCAICGQPERATDRVRSRPHHPALTRRTRPRRQPQARPQKLQPPPRQPRHGRVADASTFAELVRASPIASEVTTPAGLCGPWAQAACFCGVLQHAFGELPFECFLRCGAIVEVPIYEDLKATANAEHDEVDHSRHARPIGEDDVAEPVSDRAIADVQREPVEAKPPFLCL